MGKDKKILQQLEVECKALYEILLNMLRTLREIAEILKRNKSRKLKEALATYITAYNHARGIKVMIAFFHESIKEDEEFEMKLKEEEDYLEKIRASNRLSASSIKEQLTWHKQWLVQYERNEASKFRVMVDRLVGMHTFYTGSEYEGGPDLGLTREESEKRRKFYFDYTLTPRYKIEYTRALRSLKEMGIASFHYKIVQYTAEIIIRLKRIIKILKTQQKNRRILDQWVEERIIPDFKREVIMLERHVEDKALKSQTQILKQRLQELESLV